MERPADIFASSYTFADSVSSVGVSVPQILQVEHYYGLGGRLGSFGMLALELAGLFLEHLLEEIEWIGHVSCP